MAQEDSPKPKRGRPRAGSAEAEGEDFWTALMPEAVEQYKEAVGGRYRLFVVCCGNPL